MLIIPVGKLGDVVCTTPVFRAIRKHLPETRIYIEDNTGMNREILAHSGLSDGYLSLESLSDMKRSVKEYKIDAVVFTGPSFHELAYAYLSGVKTIITPKVTGGFCPQQTKSYRLLCGFMITTEFQIGKYAPLERLKTLEPLSIVENDTKKLLAFSEEAKNKIDNFFMDEGFSSEDDFIVGISPSVGNKIKMWDIKNFAEVIDYIIERYNAKVIITGSKSEEDKRLSKKLFSITNNKNSIINTTGQFNMDESKAIISKFKMYISVDTGPIYIAEAFNVPTVDILGPMDENEQPPRGRLNKIVKIDRENAELHIMNARIYNKKEAKRQIQEIAPKMITDEIDSLMKEIKW